MFEQHLKRYKTLNSLAERGGIVILGGDGDLSIPLCELRQAFDIEAKLYNRSLPGLSVTDAITVYDACVTELEPDTLLLHLGAADLDLLESDPVTFDRAYRALVEHVQNSTPDCRIAIVSVSDTVSGGTDDPRLATLDRHLRYIAESEHCSFADTAAHSVWSPRETRSVMSFAKAMGLGREGRRKPLYDLVKILFGSEAAMA